MGRLAIDSMAEEFDMSMRKRILYSVIIGLLATLWSIFLPVSTVFEGAKLGDLCAPLFSLKGFVSGHSAFGGQFYNNYPVTHYPFTAMMAFYPFLFIPLYCVGPLFCFMTSGVFAYALLEEGKPWKLFILLSPPYVFSLYSMQFAPLISAAFLLPCLLPVAVLKPQLGAVLLASGRWSLKTLSAALLIIAVSLFIYPNWPLDWLKHGNISLYAGKIPVLQGIGCILLLSCLKWRDRRARLLSAMSIIPQRLWYDQLMLFLIPETRHHLYILLIGSWLSVLLSITGGWYFASEAQHPTSWIMVIYFLYIPTLFIIYHKEIVIWKGSFRDSIRRQFNK
jgi:hypothetical protein